MRIALLTLHKRNSHFRKHFMETLASGIGPDVEAGGEIGRVEHGVVEGPVADEQEFGFGGEADGGIGGRLCRGWDEAG